MNDLRIPKMDPNDLQIPKMNPKEVLDLSQRILPLMQTKKGLRIIKPFNIKDVFHIEDHPVFTNSFIWDAKPGNKPPVEINIIEKIFTLHTFGYHGLFKPSIAEVIQQIPRILLPITKYFLVEGPNDCHDLNLQMDAVNAGFHRAKTTLYCEGNVHEKLMLISMNKGA